VKISAGIVGCLLVLAASAVFGGGLGQAEQTLDNFHRAAAVADRDGYLALTTEDVVFLGTDGSERWQGEEFRDFVEGHFSAGRGWIYRPQARNITLSSDGSTAWFDEDLSNEQLGQCRGSGVLVNSGGQWKIAQYNLSVPVPNAMVEQVVADIAAMESAPQSVSASQESGSAMAGTAPAAQSEVEPEAPQRADCGRKRFKTNRKGGC
jgi:ketosteroid isomerase-like protein